MPVAIDFQSNIAKVTKELNDIQRKQIPFATANALNNTAFDVMGHIQDEMPRYMDNPTPFTIKSVRVQKANKRNLISFVFIDPEAQDYIHRLVYGGTEHPKKVALVQPISSTRRYTNKWGNLKPGIVQSLKGQWINEGRGRRKAVGRKRTKLAGTHGPNKQVGKYFFGIPKGRAGQQYAGIWERHGRNNRIRQVIHFHKGPKEVNKSFPFHKIGIRHASRRFGAHFIRQMDNALATAR